MDAVGLRSRTRLAAVLYVYSFQPVTERFLVSYSGALWGALGRSGPVQAVSSHFHFRRALRIQVYSSITLDVGSLELSVLIPCRDVNSGVEVTSRLARSVIKGCLLYIFAQAGWHADANKN